MIIRLFSFIHLFTYLPLPGGGAGDMLSAPFLILDSKMGSIVCISLVHDCIHLFSFVYLLLSTSPRMMGFEHAVPLFWFWIRKWAQSFVFVSTWLYKSFFVCTPITFLHKVIFHIRCPRTDPCGTQHAISFFTMLDAVYANTTWSQIILRRYTSIFALNIRVHGIKLNVWWLSRLTATPNWRFFIAKAASFLSFPAKISYNFSMCKLWPFAVPIRKVTRMCPECSLFLTNHNA